MPLARRKTDCCSGNGCWASINRSLLLIRATYFTLFAAAAVLHPYIPVYMKELGLTPRETAIILTLGNAGSGVARAAIGALADVLNKHTVLMVICCLIAAPAHLCLYFTPPVNRNDAPSVTHDLVATLFCNDGRMAICLKQDTGGYDYVWNGSYVDGNQTGERNTSHEVRDQRGEGSKVRSSCSLRCCSTVDPTSRYGDQTLTPEQATRDAASFREDGHPTETPVWTTSEDGTTSSSTASSRRESSELPGVKVTSDSVITNPSRNCESFTNLTLGDATWTLTFDAEVTDCTSVWIFDLLGNFTSNAETCDSAAKWKYSSCTLECCGFNPYTNTSAECGHGSGEEAQFGTTFVIFFIVLFIAFFFICPVFSITDSLVYAILGDKSKDFGQIRLWGTVSLGLFAFLSGLAMDRLAEAGVDNVYLYPFIACFFFTLVAAVTSYCIPAVKKPKSPISSAASLTSLDTPLQVTRMPGLTSSLDLATGKSPSLVILGPPHLGELGVAPAEYLNGFALRGTPTHKSQHPGNVRESVTLIPQGELEKFVTLKSPGDLGKFVTLKSPGDVEEFVTLKSPSPIDLSASVSPKSQDQGESGDSVALKPPQPPSSSSSGCRNFILLFSNPIIVVNFLTVLASGIILGQHDAFFFWYLKTLGASQALLGLIIVVACASEIALLFLSGRILQVIGYRRCLYLIFAVYGVRLLVNSFIRNPWAVLGTEVTQSLCIAVLFPAVSLSINELAPAGMHGTVQGILSSLHWSIGKAIGSAIAGVLYESIGPQRMFQIFSCVSFVYGVLLAVTLETYERINRTKKKKTETDADLELNVGSNALAEPLKITGSDQSEANHLHDDESSPMMLQPQQPHQPPHQQ